MKLIVVVNILNSAVVLHEKIIKIISHTVQLYPIVSCLYCKFLMSCMEHIGIWNLAHYLKYL
jgi:hypothetical protein